MSSVARGRSTQRLKWEDSFWISNIDRKVSEEGKMNRAVPTVVTELGFSCSPLKSQCLEANIGKKGKLVLIRKTMTWGKGGFMSQNQLQRFCSAKTVEKGERISVNH